MNEFMMGMDIFIFPSFYEGLGIVLIEAQCTGLKCIVSDKISSDAIITDNVIKFKLEDEKKKWIEAIVENKIENNREIDLNKKEIKRYDLQYLLKKMYEIYEVK